MSRHSLICRFGRDDNAAIPVRAGAISHELQFMARPSRLAFGLGQFLEQLRDLGLAPHEHAIDLAILAGAVTAADTRISRGEEAEDGWTRQIDLSIPVSEPNLWERATPLIVQTLNFLTGDRWDVQFRGRPAGIGTLAPVIQKAPDFRPDCVCLFSGGLDSFIGAVDLLSEGRVPLLVSHYWDSETSKHQALCLDAMGEHYGQNSYHSVRAHVGFRADEFDDPQGEKTLRARSFLFFTLATLAASAVGGPITVFVPENGLISLNVPLDPTRLGALSTRTTHPYFMARFNDMLRQIGLEIGLVNPYSHSTKGEMVEHCRNQDFLRQQAKNTMSCSSPSKGRWRGQAPMHCGHCVPCLIRRASLLGLGDATDYSVPDLRAEVLDTSKAAGESVRSFQLAISRLDRKPVSARFDIHKAGPLSDHLGDLEAYERVYVRGIREVSALLHGVQARPR